MESHLASGRATPLKASFEATRSRDASLERIPEGSHLHAPHPLPAHSKLSQVSNESEIREKEKSDDSDEDDFQDADESHDENVKLASYTGHLEMEHTTNKMNNMSIKIEPQMPSEILRSRPASAAGTPKTGDQSWSSYFSPFSPRTPINIGNRAILSLDPDDEAFANPIDVFVHSGSNLCFGILLLLISLIPPVFSKLLYVIGFRGDRDRGLRMLWQSSKFHNVNGAMAGLVLLGYYNGIAGFCDILPDPDPSVPIDSPDNIDGYPAKRLARLLEDMRSRYPNSKLWILEEARMKAAIKDLNGGIAMLNMEHHSPLKQVHALTIFERSLQLMYAHRYQECADSFEYCGTLNNWSVALYLYIAGAAHVELYRQARTNSLPKDAILHAQKATAFFSQSRTHVGKKKFMARQLPFDTFVLRKLDKWESRAKERNIPLVSAVGVSPITEMTFLWNGFKKMTPSMLQQSLALLSSNESDPQWSSEPLDEKAILAVLRSAIFRLQGQFSKAKEILRKEVLKYDRLLFKGHLKDDWTCPTANYELAVCLWKERSGRLEDDRKLVREAEEYLDKTAKWEGYDLDARIGLKVTTGLETVRAWKAGYDT